MNGPSVYSQPAPNWHIYIKYASSIRHAKEYAYAIFNTFGFTAEDIDYCARLWKTEFYAEEAKMPFEFGGWYPMNRGQLSLSDLCHDGPWWKVHDALNRLKFSDIYDSETLTSTTLARSIGLKKLSKLTSNDTGILSDKLYMNGSPLFKQRLNLNSPKNHFYYFKKLQHLVKVNFDKSPGLSPKCQNEYFDTLARLEKPIYPGSDRVTQLDTFLYKTFALDSNNSYCHPMDWAWEYLSKLGLASDSFSRFKLISSDIPLDIAECLAKDVLSISDIRIPEEPGILTPESAYTTEGCEISLEEPPAKLCYSFGKKLAFPALIGEVNQLPYCERKSFVTALENMDEAVPWRDKDERIYLQFAKHSHGWLVPQRETPWNTLVKEDFIEVDSYDPREQYAPWPLEISLDPVDYVVRDLDLDGLSEEADEAFSEVSYSSVSSAG
jgi:hypothetical protein